MFNFYAIIRYRMKLTSIKKHGKSTTYQVTMQFSKFKIVHNSFVFTLLHKKILLATLLRNDETTSLGSLSSSGQYKV